MNVPVSDFVFPAYFNKQASPGSKLDWLGRLTAPWSYTAGGYLITRSAGKIAQAFGDELPEWKKIAKTFPAARTARREAQSAP